MILINKKLKWIIILGLTGLSSLIVGGVVLVVILISRLAPTAIDQSKNLVEGATAELQKGLHLASAQGCIQKIQ